MLFPLCTVGAGDRPGDRADFRCACHVSIDAPFYRESWIGQLANFVILQVLVVAVGSLLISCLDSTFTAIDSYSDVLMRPIAFCAIGIAALYIFYHQLPGIASRWRLAAPRWSMVTTARDAHEGMLAETASTTAG